MLDSQRSDANSASVSDSGALESLRREIELHDQHEKSRSYLGRGVGWFYSADDKSLASLKQLQADIDQANKTGDTAKAAELTKKVSEQVDADRKAIGSQDSIAGYATGALKTAGMFLGGKLGFWGTAAIYAIDQMCPEDSASTQAFDGVLGFAKGALLKKSFDKIGAWEVGPLAKGVALGFTARSIDLGLTRQTYFNQTTGKYSAAAGLKNIALPGAESVLVDGAVYWLAHGALGELSTASGGAIEKSPLWKTMLTGTTFGISSGSLGEIARQREAGEAFDLGKVAKQALIHGTIDTFAAAPGGLRARAQFKSALAAQTGGHSDASTAVSGSSESKAALNSVVADPAKLSPEVFAAEGRKVLPVEAQAEAGQTSDRISPPREFVLTGGADALAGLRAGSKEAMLRVREILSRRPEGQEDLDTEKSLFVQHLGQGDRLNVLAASYADLVATCSPEKLDPAIRSKHLFPDGEGSVWLNQGATPDRVTLSLGDKPLETANRRETPDAMMLGGPKFKGPRAVDILRDQGHDDLADALSSQRKFASLRAVGWLGEGNDSKAIELPPSAEYRNGAVLKISEPEGGWNRSWGKREFDAWILGEVHEVELDDGRTVHVYIQELAETRDNYEPEDLNRFFEKVARSGLEFQDPGADPTKQIGYSKETNELVLIDYPSVDKKGANETLQQIIGGRQRADEQYDAENERGYQEEQPEYEEVDPDVERIRHDMLADPARSEDEKSILQELFQGSSVEDAVIMRACQLKAYKNGKLDTTQARKEVMTLYRMLKTAGLLPEE